MVNKIDPIEEANRKRSSEISDSAQAAIMQAAMNKNPARSQEANNVMADTSQGVSAVSDTQRRESINMESQQVHATGDSSKVSEAKNSGLSVGVRIETPEETQRNQQTEKLLTSSTDQLALYNRNDLINKQGQSQSTTDNSNGNL